MLSNLVIVLVIKTSTLTLEIRDCCFCFWLTSDECHCRLYNKVFFEGGGSVTSFSAETADAPSPALLLQTAPEYMLTHISLIVFLTQ